MRMRFREVRERTTPRVTEDNYRFEINARMTVDQIWDTVKNMVITTGLPDDIGEWHSEIPCIVDAYQHGRYTENQAKAEIAELLKKADSFELPDYL